MPKKGSISLILLFSFLTSCGYQWQHAEEVPTVCIPFIPDDEDGALTNEIATALTQSGLAQVHYRNADYRLEVKINKVDTEITGFRLDPQKINGKIRKHLLSCEERKTVSVEATFYNFCDEIVYGPYTVAADADYDYIDEDSLQDLTFINSDGVPTVVLPFSLGQLEPRESARDAATRPLYRHLAQKIVDAIAAEW
jgi:outer membrane lipopolysaccharide assembly protein LptE/RlpB